MSENIHNVKEGSLSGFSKSNKTLLHTKNTTTMLLIAGKDKKTASSQNE